MCRGRAPAAFEFSNEPVLELRRSSTPTRWRTNLQLRASFTRPEPMFTLLSSI
jgi:hypothetical protein